MFMYVYIICIGVHSGRADSHLLQVIHWLGISTPYNPKSKDHNYQIKGTAGCIFKIKHVFMDKNLT